MSDSVEIISSAANKEPKVFSARLGHTIRTNPRPIARHCIKELAPISEDIATIIESLALADRLQTRRRADGWSRRLGLKIPVFEHDSLCHSGAVAALIDAAGFLTGDEWQIDFTRRLDRPLSEQYLSLALDTPQFVVPYSNGLDSFAQARLLQHDHGVASVLPLRAGKLQHGGETNRPLLTVPRGFNAGHPRERTYRTRPLVYFSLAAVGAATIGASTVVIGENGQGGLGPSFARFSDEWPFRSTHPGFVSRLASFLNRSLGTSISFEQPQLWRTKGEVLRELAERGIADGWQSTLSCSTRPYQRDGRRSCGFCGGCILRRTALHAADYQNENGVMFQLEAAGLTYQSSTGCDTPVGANEREILLRACMSMDAFAGARSRADAADVLARQGRDIPDISDDEVSMRLASLIDRHAIEWHSLIESLPADAWLRAEFGSL